MNAEEIKQGLAGRAEEFARWLFLSGRKELHNWRVGSLNGEKGQSFALCIEGAKIGVFKDFATGEGGDNLIELFAQARSVSFKEALRACAEWLAERRSVLLLPSIPPAL